ncbi:type I restriction enzyme S subunit [Thermonema lapsum]|uniref:Type I restriction enzyme S subunit n=1 Tax=Thermonema lapsum TaxID=28195 RepID=A0A846MQU7_9BACT|nr:restriction endonuclease subunit S [Thermonema lapsum]NIK73801.1 type I restriction enzyme S subunit [Thermonema lapsum]
MSKNNQNKLVPRLRFPEFQNAGEWEVKRLGEVIEERNERTTIKNQYPLLTSSKKGIFLQEEYFDKQIASLSNIGYKIIFRNDFTYRSMSDSGDFTFNIQSILEKGIVSPAYPVFYISEKNTNRLFLYYYLNFSRVVKNQIFKLTQGGTRLALPIKALKKIIVQFPSLPEQQKIAACLSSLDEVIAGEREKLALLQQHKKGLLQQLFPQEGETVPRLRFPEFQNAGEWEVKRLGEVYEFKPTNSFSRDCLNYENGLVKNIHYGDIHTKFDTLFDISKEKVPFINPYLPIEKIKEESYCKEGDIIFADASEDLNDVGKSIEIINLNNEKVVSGLHTLLARQKENLLVIGFGGYLFKSEWVRKQIQKEAQGAKVFGISATRISNVKIKFPKNKSEQQKIAACLSSLDDLIAAQTEKIELLEQHKKGLLQGLFPVGNG